MDAGFKSVISGQLPLDLPAEPAFERDNLVVSQANAMAADLIDAWPNWPGSLVVLVGPAGSGKSHLARIWSTASKAAILDMAQLDADLPPRTNTLVIEDAKPGAIAQKALFHVLNHLRAEGGHCLITAQSAPSAWGLTLPDLASRLRAAHLVRIAPPDDALLSAVLVKLFADRQIEPPAGIVEWLLPRMERSLDAAGKLVAQMDALAMARGSAINRAVAAAALQHLTPSHD